MTLSLLLGALAAALFTLASTTSLKFDESIPLEPTEIIYRLPTNIIPNHYDIDLIPNFLDANSPGNFTGMVTINVTVVDTTNVIIVHSDGLNINESATLVYSATNNSLLTIATQNSDALRHFHILTFVNNLPLGEYIITFIYSREFATDMYGFYRTSYQAGNESRWLVTTRFQPTAARRAFPCFDEPGLKATFNVRIAHYPNQVALSNMPNISTSAPNNTIGGRVWTQFDTTLRMSSYLLAFIVSDFESVSSANQFFGIWSRPEAIGSTAWALESTQALYSTFLNAVLTEDPWPKIDQVAVPELITDAVENWGLITYTENSLLWQDGESSLRAREVIASTISHELSHIWFGNLVSPKWWDHLWFIEGFASFYEYLIPSLTYPQWRYAERFVTDLQLPAMIIDSSETTRPMTNVVGNPDSIQASFDSVAFYKSAAVIRMLNRIMREDFFSLALSNFFSESAFGTFEPDTLWSHMQAVADANTTVQNHVPIKRVMDSWVNQPGYPLVTVVRNYSTMVAAFRQERFFINPNSPTANPESQAWWIPITFTTGNAPEFCNSDWLQPDWIRAQDKAITVSNVANGTWLLANCQAIGFYRINYDTRNWELLTEFLNGPNFTQINAINRAVLIDDSLNLARAGYIDYSIALNLINYLSKETDFVVWRAAIPGLSYLNKILTSDENSSNWQAYLQNLILNLYQSLGWVAASVDTHEVRLHRAQILHLACQLDNAGARSSARDLFNLWIANPQLNPIDPDLRSVAYCWGVSEATEATWNILWNRFLTSDLATEEDLILRGLACSQNSTILEKYLQLTITPNSGIRPQDRLTVFLSIVNSDHDNVDTVLNFVANNTEAITEFYGGFNVFARILHSISSQITRQDQLDKFQAFVNSDAIPTSSVVIESALQTATRNLEWIANQVPIIQDWVVNQNETETTVTSTTTTIETTTQENVTTGGGTTFSSHLFLIFSFAVLAVNNLLGT